MTFLSKYLSHLAGDKDSKNPANSPEANNQKPTNLGIQFDRLVANARSHSDWNSKDEVYCKIRDNFDFAFYVARYPDIAEIGNVDPVKHYIDHGAEEGRDPSAGFNTALYRQRYAEIIPADQNPFYHWLTIGQSEGSLVNEFSEFSEMCELLDRPEIEVEGLLSDKRADLVDRLMFGELGAMVKKAAELEPTINLSWPSAIAPAPAIQPFYSDHIVKKVAAIHKLQKQVEFRPANAVVVVPDRGNSDAALISGSLILALCQIYGDQNVVVVATEEGTEDAFNRIGSQARLADFYSSTSSVPQEHKPDLLLEFLRSMAPDVIFNVNSDTMWEVIKIYGKIVSEHSEIYGYFLPEEQNVYGYDPCHTMQKFYSHFEDLTGSITPSKSLELKLKQVYQLPDNLLPKLKTLLMPFVTEPEVVPEPERSGTKRPVVFCSGNTNRSGDVRAIAQIADKLPKYDFWVYGHNGESDVSSSGFENRSNVSFKGRYDTVDDLPLDKCEAWLNTTFSGDVSLELIEIAGRAVPIVSSTLGIAIDEETSDLSWFIGDADNIDDYVSALKEVLSDPDSARRKAHTLRNRLIETRSFEKFRNNIKELLESRCAS